MAGAGLSASRPRAAATVLAVVTAGCGRLPYPYTAAELGRDSQDRAGEALVHYLTQPNADTGVCDPEAGTLRRFAPSDFEVFLEGLDEH